jgi:hypothetical protein
LIVPSQEKGNFPERVLAVKRKHTRWNNAVKLQIWQNIGSWILNKIAAQDSGSLDPAGKCYADAVENNSAGSRDRLAKAVSFGLILLTSPAV